MKPFRERVSEEAELRTADAPDGPIKVLAVMYQKGFNEGAEWGYRQAIEELLRHGELGIVCARTLEEKMRDKE